MKNTSSSQETVLQSIPSDQKNRRKKVAQIASTFCHRWYTPEGKWNDPREVPDARGGLWLCFGLFNGEARDIALANAILKELAFSLHVPSRSEAEKTVGFDIFVTNHATQMLVLHASKMTDEVREKMESWARAGLKDFPGNRQYDYQFHGYNDNMPSKATMGMILGGEYFGDAAAVEQGVWNLQQLRSMLTRRGLVSEYTSCTYLPLTLLNLSEIANHAKHKEARELAAKCAERVWADVLGHFHSPTGLMGGPYSRSYQLDSTGHLSNMNGLLWFTFGEGIIPNPSEEVQRSPIRLVHHEDVDYDSVGTLSWMCSCDLNPPAYLLDWLNNRNYPFTLRASAERGDGGASYYPGESNTTHYQEKDFALGTVFGESWSQLQTDTFYLQYRKKAPAKGVEDVRTGYLRYLINDQMPKDNEHGLKPHGIAHAIADRRVVLGLSRPSMHLEGKEVNSLKLTFIFTTHFGSLERVEIIDGHVFIQDGPMYLALRPLNITDWGCKESIKIEPVEHYLQVSFYNYEGPARKFSADELGRTLNGYVAVIGLANEESFEAFRKRVLSAVLIDMFNFDVRTVRYQLGDTLIETSYGVKADRFRFATVNGRLLPRPAWEADDMPAEKLPFFGEPAIPTPLTIPYSHLKVIWAPEAPWIIASKGLEKIPEKIVGGKGWEKTS